MTEPLVMPPNVDALVVDYLTANLDEPGTTVGVVPNGWTPSDTAAHVGVESFSSFHEHPVIYRPTVRLVARALSPTRAYFLAAKALGVLAAHPGGGGISGVTPLRGPDSAFDDTSHTEFAAVELQVNIRSIPIT